MDALTPEQAKFKREPGQKDFWNTGCDPQNPNAEPGPSLLR